MTTHHPSNETFQHARPTATMDGSSDIAATFVHPCLKCAATVRIIDTVEQPHECEPFESRAAAIARAWWTGHDAQQQHNHTTKHDHRSCPVVSGRVCRRVFGSGPSCSCCCCFLPSRPTRVRHGDRHRRRTVDHRMPTRAWPR